MKIFDAEQIKKDYEITPSLRILAKRYHTTPRTIKKYILLAGGVLNFKKGTTINYKSNNGSFTKGQRPWNKGKKMSTNFRQRQKNIMLRLVSSKNYISPSQRYGAAEKISIAHRGEKNPAWKGGITAENKRKRSILVKKNWSKAVIKRDDHTCQECGATNNLIAHHIKPFIVYPELSNEIENGITLCGKCHYKTYKNEKKYENYFLNILKRKLKNV